MHNNNFEKELTAMYYRFGGYTLRNMIISKSTEYIKKKLKHTFGLDMVFDNINQIDIATSWIKQYDSKFKYHISNAYVLGDIKNEKPEIEGEFIIKLESCTYLYCKASGYKQMQGVDLKAGENKSLYLYFFGKKMYKYYKQLKKYMDDMASSENMMYSITSKNDGRGGNYWTCVGSTLTLRSMDTLYFDNYSKEKIISHLDKWLANEDIYVKRGLTFKTGILLYGTKGTGKSSLATAIATYLKCGLINIDCTTFQDLNIPDVVESINADDDRYVVLLDEVDSLFISRDGDDANAQKERTAKLLGFLDGPNSPTNVVFVLTTNYKNRLDKAAIREGRIDLEIELKDISEHAAREMCENFELPEDKIDKILSECEFPVNPALLQNKILYNK